MLGQEELDEFESDGLLGEPKTPVRKSYRHPSNLQYVLAISLSFNILLMSGLIYWVWNRQSLRHSYENGFESDLESISSEIELIQYRFTGGVELDENGDFSVDNSTRQQYVGHPTLEIDHAWDKLLAGLNVDLEDSEARYMEGRTFQWPGTGHYFTGLEVFHSLHCLNRIRQAFYPDYYDVFDHTGDPSREAHIGHCIDHIRQSIQCHADLTPMEWTRVEKKIILKTDTFHTCRNFGKFLDWARQRSTDFEEIEAVTNGSLYVVD